MARKERYLVGLDVGTSKVTAVVGEVPCVAGEGLDCEGIGVADLDLVVVGIGDVDVSCGIDERSSGEVQLRAGAGLVVDSLAAAELEETRAKARGLLRALGVEATSP